MKCWHYGLGILSVSLAVLLNGCGSGTGIDGRTADDGGVDQAVAVVEADWLVVDLATGSLEPRSSVADLATNAAYRTTHLVLRRIAASTGTIGSPSGSRWAQADETPGPASAAAFFIGAFELTRGQWRRLSATTPWRDVTPASLAGLADDDHLPACGMSLDQVLAACSGWSRAGRWSVPTSTQWETACRAGATGLFHWGDQIDEATVARYAVVRQTAGGSDGPRPVGLREANALGLYDVHGNVWEWTSEARLRGGSWNDGLPMARAANQIALDTSTPHALAGVRLVYAP
jgi:formylglycine-generating enzyme required for sulfatase activity